MNPPIVYDETIPKSHSTRSTTKIVHNKALSSFCSIPLTDMSKFLGVVARHSRAALGSPGAAGPVSALFFGERFGEFINLALGFLFRYPVTLLDLADQLFPLTLDHIKIVVCELSPLFLHFA
jgi:hypothetical protein